MGFLLQHSISEAAARAPEHDAFRIGGASITYSELERRSSQLARTLVERGVRRMDRVGLYLQKSLELPVALYGILKAGGAYVPIDPTAPASRVDFIVRDCGLRHLITEPAKRRRVLPLSAGHSKLGCIVGLQGSEGAEGDRFMSWSEIEERDDRPPDVRTMEQDLAYIMYTSGSTGAPKGLMHTHHSGLSYARLSAALYGVRPEDRLGNHSPLHFDMSTFEYLTGPLCGATTVIIPEEVTMFPVGLSELIETERLTFWYSVPLALIQLLNHGELERRDHSSLRWVLFGGEPFPPKHLARLMELWPGARFSNSYGPAEVNQCTYYHLPTGETAADETPDETPPGALDGDHPIPIPLGEIWPDADGLVVDGSDRPVADGESGELLIRAPTMMQGYWRRPDLNQRAFFDRVRFNGFRERYYRTGDLVRRGDDGLLHFLGRKDRQIKVRGYRVELDEVESVLADMAEVSEAAAIAVESAEGALEIVGLVLVADEAAAGCGQALRDLAAEKLPHYAVPRRVEVRSAFPRTGSGKIDRRRLTEELSLETADAP